MKEVYEKQTLHRLLGVSQMTPPTLSANGTNGTAKPKSNGKESRSRTPVVVVDGAAGSTSNGKPNGKKHPRTEDVHDAWAEADTVLSDEDEERAGHARVAEEQDGRYAIGLLPPKKRRKTGKHASDAHVVTFTADSDDSDSDSDGELEPPRPKEKEKLGGVKDKVGGAQDDQGGESLRIKGMASRSSSSSSVKRDYWLSKGIGLGGDGGDD